MAAPRAPARHASVFRVIGDFEMLPVWTLPLLQPASASSGKLAQRETAAATFADRCKEVRAVWQGNLHELFSQL